MTVYLFFLEILDSSLDNREFFVTAKVQWQNLFREYRRCHQIRLIFLRNYVFSFLSNPYNRRPRKISIIMTSRKKLNMGRQDYNNGSSRGRASALVGTVSRFVDLYMFSIIVVYILLRRPYIIPLGLEDKKTFLTSFTSFVCVNRKHFVTLRNYPISWKNVHCTLKGGQ